MASLNIASLVKHIEELRILVLTHKFDLIAINESRLDQNVADSQIRIVGYDIIRRDRYRHAGGICIYLKTNINHRVRAEITLSNMEALCVEIQNTNSKSFAVLCCVVIFERKTKTHV